MNNDFGQPIDIRWLQQQRDTNPIIRRGLDFLASQSDLPREITATDFAKRMNSAGIPDAHRYEAIRFFQAIDGGNRGKYKVGRRKGKTRFQFYLTPADLGKAALIADELGKEDTAAEMVEHKLMLRPRVVISVPLPIDVTKVEIERVIAFLRTLWPFGDDPAFAAA